MGVTMKLRRPIMLTLLITIALIFLYNYVILPFMVRTNTGMGMMGMHGRMYAYYNPYTNFGPILILLSASAVIFLIIYYLSRNSNNRCSKCGTNIESERWRVCPNCGNPLVKKGGQ